MCSVMYDVMYDGQTFEQMWSPIGSTIFQNAPKSVWRPGSVRTRWWRLQRSPRPKSSPRPLSWICGRGEKRRKGRGEGMMEGKEGGRGREKGGARGKRGRERGGVNILHPLAQNSWLRPRPYAILHLK